MSFPKIAIIGAGPSGLTLAALLQRHFPNSIAIYESDSSRHSRDQGGTLDLHHDSGQLALKEAGLHEKFLEHARPEGETLRIYSPDGRVLMDESKNGGDGEGGKGERDGEGDKGERGLCREGEVGGGAKRPDYMKGRPEIDRVVLRGMLLDSLAEGTVQWGRRLLKVVEDNGTCTYELHFGDGSVENGFDLVVGADGAWSKVRPLVTDTVPFYSGIQGLDVRVTDVDRRFPELSERVGNGMCLTLGENKGILAQRNGDGCIRVYAFLRATETWQQECGVDWTDMESAKKEVIEKCFGDWDGLAKDLVLKSDPDSACVRQMYMLPVGVRWFGKAGVTLIGDAAHLMAPFAGVGVNVAMHDALELAHAIIAQKDSLVNPSARTVIGTSGGFDQSPVTHMSSALGKARKIYEAVMFGRAEKNAKETMMYLDLFFHERGGVAMVEHFERVKKQEMADKAAERGADEKMTVGGLAVKYSVSGGLT